MPSGIVIAISVLSASHVTAAGAASQEQEHFEASVDLDRLIVTVIDSQGRPVVGLGREDFAVFDAGTAQEILVFLAVNDVPVDIALLLDASTSVGGNLSRLLEGAARLQRALAPVDRLFVAPFSTYVGEGIWVDANASLPGSDFSELEIGGSTALHDALTQAISNVEAAQHRSWFPESDAPTLARGGAVIVVTDGEDHSSHWTYAETLVTALQAAVPLHAVAIGPASQATGRPVGRRLVVGRQAGSSRSGVTAQVVPGVRLRSTLRRLVDLTGGSHFRGRSPAEILDAYDRILSMIRASYLIGYRPGEPLDRRASTGVETPVEVRIVNEDLRAEARDEDSLARRANSVARRAEQDGLVLLRNQQLSAAMAAFQSAIRQDSSLVWAHYYEGVIAGLAGDAGAAYASAERALENGPNHPKIQDLAIRAASLGGDYAKAWDHAVDAVHAGADIGILGPIAAEATPPAMLDLRLAAPSVYVDLEPPAWNDQELIIELTRLLQAVRRGFENSPLVALAGRPVDASHILLWRPTVRATRIDGRFDVYTSRGPVGRVSLEFERGSNDGASALQGAVQQLIEELERDVAEWARQGLREANLYGELRRHRFLNERLGQHDATQAYYRAVLEREPNNAAAIIGLAMSKWGEGSPNDAKALLHRARSASHDDMTALANVAEANVNLGEYERAVDCYERLLQLDSENLPSRLRLGYLQLGLGQTDRARESFAAYRVRAPAGASESEIVTRILDRLQR